MRSLIAEQLAARIINEAMEAIPFAPEEPARYPFTPFPPGGRTPDGKPILYWDAEGNPLRIPLVVNPDGTTTPDARIPPMPKDQKFPGIHKPPYVRDHTYAPSKRIIQPMEVK